MRVLFLTNSDDTMPLSEWLRQHDEVIVHNEKLQIAEFERKKADIVVSYAYRHIVKTEILELLPGRFINLHISLLPYNRGSDPNVWSFLEDTPKGVTIHVMDKGVDTGPILVQKQVHFDEERETLKSTYYTLHCELQALCRRNWLQLRNGEIEAVAQSYHGTSHRTADLVDKRDFLLGEEGWDVPVKLLKRRYEMLLRK